jgi:hypothetical protein
MLTDEIMDQMLLKAAGHMLPRISEPAWATQRRFWQMGTVVWFIHFTNANEFSLIGKMHDKFYASIHRLISLHIARFLI